MKKARRVPSWDELHCGAYKRLSPVLAEGWKRSIEEKVDPLKKELDVYDPDAFLQVKSESDNQEFFILSKSTIKDIVQTFEMQGVGIGIVSRDCCLLKAFGDNAFMEWAVRKGIRPGSLWSNNSAGVNAISIGMERKTLIYTAGSEHYCKMLGDVSIYFAPVYFSQSTDPLEKPKDIYCGGGIALFTPFLSQGDAYGAVVSLIARLVSFHYSTIVSTVGLIDVEGIAILGVDYYKGRKSVLYYNDSLFKVLEIPEEPLFYKQLDYLIDPVPENRAFWSLIESRKPVRNLPVTLSIRGKKYRYVIKSATPHSNLTEKNRGICLTISSVRQSNEALSKMVGHYAKTNFSDMIGENYTFKRAIQIAERIAPLDNNILILGESGTGKDLLAQSIHNASDRKSHPFVVLNCAALPRDLIASELFGHVEGAYTGSKRGGQMGKLELADGGTLFLDEIGDMPLDLQAVLLRVIEQKSFMRIGSNTNVQSDVRIISATNADLERKVKENKFRADLYYRLCGIRIMLPPLRERGKDIELLASYFVKRAVQAFKFPSVELDIDAISLLNSLPWNGNVRELQHTIESVLYLADGVITVELLREYLGLPKESQAPNHVIIIDEQALSEEEQQSRSLTKEYLEKVLIEYRYNKLEAAKALSISRPTLYKYMKQYNIQ